jgi:ATP:ADP antiporter, AAA family
MSKETRVDRLLRPFAKVNAGEGVIAVLMMLCVFLILTSYYVMKTAREGLILSDGAFGLDGEELKTYATGAMAVLLLAVVPAYSALANRVKRIRLINLCYALVMASLFGFFAAGRAGLPVGLPFFIWLGLVSIFLISQFWSYANDLYSEEQGKRLFAIIAIGGSAGAIVGPKLTKLADTYAMMLVAAGILVGSLVLFNLIERLHVARQKEDKVASEPISGAGGFSLVLRDKYLLLIAGMLVVANLVNTTGEYILSTAASDYAEQLGVTGDDKREAIKAFYADFFFWVNLIGFVVQAFLVSRIIKYAGVRKSLFALPLIAFLAYGMIGIVGGFALVRLAKIGENATDYSVQNTVRQALFLPTDRSTKYKAKAAIDTFFVRGGDMLAALLIWVGLHLLGAGAREFALVNLGLVLVWVAIAIGIARKHRELSPDEDGEKLPVKRKTAEASA